MTVLRKKEALLLFAGDVFFFLLSLWLMLFLRYGTIPDRELFYSHLAPFSILFVVWVFVFFIAGLYEKHTLILRHKIPGRILRAQIVNSGIAVLFFYLVSSFGIAPKTNLFIYLILSFCFLLAWRIHGEALFGTTKKQNAILIGSGSEMKELMQEVNNNPRYDLYFISSIELDLIKGLDFKTEILDRIYTENVQVIAVDLKNEKVAPVLPNLYNLIFSNIRFIDMYKIYEDIFDRIPLSVIQYNWFLENISTKKTVTYDFLKRIMDVFVGGVSAVVSLVFYPFIMLAIKLEGGGPIFIMQERVGKNAQLIRTYKFRTMARNEIDLQKGADNHVTRVGNFLRKTRLDELPQLWAVVAGSMSLIGPRPELPSGVKLYENEIPYYHIRHLIKPGLSGWAQLYHDNHPHHGLAVEATKEKLSYDLYYIKNRSFVLDVKITLKTIKALLSRSGA